MRISALILDLDGTLIDTETVSKNAWEQAARELGFEFPQALYASIAGRSIASARRKIKSFIANSADFDRFMHIAHDIYINDMNTNGVRVNEGVHEIVDYAGQTALAAMIATSTARQYADMKMKLSGLEGHLHVAVAGDEVENGKPAPDLFLRAAAIASVRPEQCIVIEDAEAGVEAAHAAGMIPIMVPSTIDPSDNVRQICHAVVPDLNEALKVIRSIRDQFE